MYKKIIGILICTLFIGTIIIPSIIGSNVETSNIIAIEKNFKDQVQQTEIKKWIIISPPIPKNTSDSIVNVTRLLADTSEDKVILSNVPTSKWTYGCTATSAGMLFGYYDRIGYNNMYTGPANYGVCPLTNLGQGIGTPIPGSCYIIATQKGLDGIDAKAHVDDYWKSSNSPG
ncbi:MAG: hypothetical protein MUO82_08945, partial [Candidatus Thermoplasmatota archaeon]|nr:hypothetical protein [Candidatus Thermoplasmatota archaeon]